MHWEIVSVGIIALLFLLFIYVENKDVKYTTISIGDKKLKAEVADTALKKSKGLMFRDQPPEAILFISSSPSRQGIWMRNVKFPIDIIWVNNGEIIDIVEDAQPCKTVSCPVYYPKGDAQYIIELPANWTKDNKISIGTKVKIWYI